MPLTPEAPDWRMRQSAASRRSERAASSSCVFSSASVNVPVHCGSAAIRFALRQDRRAEGDEDLRARLGPEGILNGERNKRGLRLPRGERAEAIFQPKRTLANIHEAALRREPDRIARRCEEWRVWSAER